MFVATELNEIYVRQDVPLHCLADVFYYLFPTPPVPTGYSF